MAATTKRKLQETVGVDTLKVDKEAEKVFKKLRPSVPAAAAAAPSTAPVLPVQPPVQQDPVMDFDLEEAGSVKQEDNLASPTSPFEEDGPVNQEDNVAPPAPGTPASSDDCVIVSVKKAKGRPRKGAVKKEPASDQDAVASPSPSAEPPPRRTRPRAASLALPAAARPRTRAAAKAQVAPPQAPPAPQERRALPAGTPNEAYKITTINAEYNVEYFGGSTPGAHRLLKFRGFKRNKNKQSLWCFAVGEQPEQIRLYTAALIGHVTRVAH